MSRRRQGVVALLLAIGLVAIGLVLRRDGAMGGFDAGLARSLIPEAAGADPGLLAKLVDLGATVTDEDILSRGTVPLTALLFQLNPSATRQDPGREAEVLRDWWHLMRSQVSSRELLVRAGPALPRWRGGQGTYVTLLRPDYLRDVSVIRTSGAEASGTAEFQRGDEFGGRVEWTARRGPNGWRIEEFRLPGRRIRVRLLDGVWVPEDEQHPSVWPWRRDSVEFALTRSDLPLVGVVAPVPPPGIEVALPEFGFHLHCWALRRSIEFTRADFEEVARAHREGDGFCGLDVVLRLHSRTPWGVVEPLLGALQDPRVRVYRTHFAAVTVGGAVEGVLPCFLPKSSDVSAVGAGAPAGEPLRVRLEPDANAMDWGRAEEALRRLSPGSTTWVVSLRAAPTVATGDVVRVLDLLRRRGVSRIDIAEPQVGEQVDSPSPWPGANHRFRLDREASAGFRMQVGTETIVGTEPAQGAAPGAGPR